MIYALGWSSRPIRTIEVPEPEADPLEFPEPARRDDTWQPEPVPVPAGTP